MAIGLVIHSALKSFSDLAFKFAKHLRKIGRPCYVFSAGKLTPQKLGNFSDIGAYVLFGCKKPIYGEASFYVPIISPFELLCHLEYCNFWNDSYTDDPTELNSILEMAAHGIIKDVSTDSKSTDLYLKNMEYSIQAFSSKNFKGAPFTINEPLERGSFATILPGTTGLPRHYHDL